jgi:hypothetical protein
VRDRFRARQPRLLHFREVGIKRLGCLLVQPVVSVNSA